MTFSRERYQDAISRNETIEPRERAYYRQRFLHIVFENVMTKFAERAEKHGLTKARMARLIGKDPSQINRALALPSNMTLEMLSDMALAMGCEPDISLGDFEDAVKHNDIHCGLQNYYENYNTQINKTKNIIRVKSRKDLTPTLSNRSLIGAYQNLDQHNEAA